MIARLSAFVIPLGFDTLAVAIALGFRGVGPWRPAIVFAIFETVMPLVGIALGHVLSSRFATAASVIGGVVLIAVGVRAFREAAEEGEDAAGLSFGSVRAAALAGIAISTDELAVGFPLGTSHLPIAPLVVAIGLQAFVVTLLGIVVGRRIGELLGRRAVRISGTFAAIAFTAVGVWIIVESLMSRNTG